MSALDRLTGRVRNMLSRAVLRLVDDGQQMQSVQVETRADVVRDKVERFQQYGVRSFPHPGAEAVVLALGGSTDHSVVLAVDDRRYGVRGMRQGEMAIYDDLGQCVHLTREGIIFKGAGLPMTFTDTPLVTIDSKLHVTGKVTTDDDALIGKNLEAVGTITDLVQTGEGMSMSGMRDTYNSHDHEENHDTTTSTPNQQMG